MMLTLTLEQRENIQKLVHELRTTEKLQGQDYLASRGTYCCMGIACEIALSNGVKLDVYRPSAGRPVWYYNSLYTLPKEVQDFYGFDNSDPALFAEDGELSCASELNDLKNYSFTRIADAFERTYLSE